MATMKDIGASYARNAGADLSAALYKFAAVDTDEDIILCNASLVPLGVIIEAALENKPVTVQTGGNGKVIVGAGGAVVAGAAIKSDALGCALSATSGAAGIVGVAVNGGAAGEIIEFAFTAG